MLWSENDLDMLLPENHNFIRKQFNCRSTTAATLRRTAVLFGEKCQQRAQLMRGQMRTDPEQFDQKAQSGKRQLRVCAVDLNCRIYTNPRRHCFIAVVC